MLEKMPHRGRTGEERDDGALLLEDSKSGNGGRILNCDASVSKTFTNEVKVLIYFSSHMRNEMQQHQPGQFILIILKTFTRVIQILKILP
jgi:hypothetical protein